MPLVFLSERKEDAVLTRSISLNDAMIHDDTKSRVNWSTVAHACYAQERVSIRSGFLCEGICIQ
jgi:hypothetical protein